MKRPSFQFYPGDWLRDSGLRTCSVGARGLWMDMLCYMHEGTPYGHLKVNLKVILPSNLAAMVGATFQETEGWLKELEDAGVFSRTEDGTMFSRRMIRDEEIRVKRASGGVKGGNPALIGQHTQEPGRLTSRITTKVKQKPTPSSSSSSASNSASVAFTTAWVEMYLTATGRTYVHQGAKDATAVNRILAMNRSAQDLIDLAKWALTLGDSFIAQQASTISSFSANISRIETARATATRNGHKKPIDKDTNF